MKTLMITALLALLAGCSSMGMQRGTSGDMGTTSSQTGAGADNYQRDDVFHSWID